MAIEISAVVTIRCQYCGKITEEVLSNYETVTVICDNDECGANYEVSLNCRESE